ncbi:type VI secretion system tube protein TssD [uncultured Bacteroides sp.]|uniref:type VI secretion system tube protein TssD n=1 Tax=uncultured Bacteroides sp. TaxID=162156 RepID=UPI0025CE1680|nr:type VI secretion system tube protein TssD [uncultured Bacteroides sp.]
MAELRATVCLQGKDIEVISSHIEFSRKTDTKGRPVTNVTGGRITITIESTKETILLEAMVNSPFKAISGKVIYYNTEDNSVFRVVEFKYSYIVHYKEVFNVDRKRQMYSTITFSADIIMIGDAYLSNQW